MSSRFPMQSFLNFQIASVVRSFLIFVTIAEVSANEPEFCSDLKSVLQKEDVYDFVRILNDQWKIWHSEAAAQSNETCQRTMKEILENCSIAIETRTPLKRPTPTEYNPNKAEDLGVIDIRIVQGDYPNLVIKLRYNKNSCTAVSQILKYLESGIVDQLYPNEKIILLALGFEFNPDKAITDWTALFYQNKEIIDAKHDAPCLRSKTWSAKLRYQEKALLEYFPKIDSTTSSP